MELRAQTSHGNVLVSPNFSFNFVVCNPCQSSPSLTILVPLWFIIICLVFSYLSEVLFSGFLQFKRNFVDGRNNSKYRDVAPLKNTKAWFTFHINQIKGRLVKHQVKMLGIVQKILYQTTLTEGERERKQLRGRI